MDNLKNNIYFKLGAIVILTLILLAPSQLIMNLIQEREHVHRKAIEEVSDKWSNSQTITGPIMTIPYDKYVKELDSDKKEKIVKYKEYIHVLPQSLNINGNISPEKRMRGIYEIIVYNSKLKIEGNFKPIDLKEFEIDEENIHYDQAFISVGISDLKGIEKQIKLKWNDNSTNFSPGTVTRDVLNSGINCPVSISNDDSLEYAYSLSLDLNGSQYLHFVPVGKTSDVNITSDWGNPSFDGEFLPDSRTVAETGFKAHWNVLHLNRNFPQQWIGGNHTLLHSAFGVNLLLPVDAYQKNMRVAKYAILFVLLTFTVFFFVEVLRKVFIHPVQYLLVGIALVVFFTLLLSISEHLSFNSAYIISAIATLVLISTYIRSFLKSIQLTFLTSGILLILYSFIYTIVQLQDYALLIGSIGIFLVLALVMYFSRKIDWYNIGKDSKGTN